MNSIQILFPNRPFLIRKFIINPYYHFILSLKYKIFQFFHILIIIKEKGGNTCESLQKKAT